MAIIIDILKAASRLGELESRISRNEDKLEKLNVEIVKQQAELRHLENSVTNKILANIKADLIVATLKLESGGLFISNPHTDTQITNE
ncbi:MAG: hypothetical protein AAF585_15385, partial [Verrucomicrobiota bacterium]